MTAPDPIGQLYSTIQARKGADPADSYTASLLAKGPEKCAQKLGEEAVETVIAAGRQDRAEIISESADLIYHLLVLLASFDIKPSDVYAELENRQGQSGHEEKAGRSG